MRKTLLILRHEIYALLRRKSFWFGVLGVPLIGFLIYAGVAYINRAQGVADAGTPQANPAAGIEKLFTSPEDTRPQGYVDLSGLVKIFPSGFARGEWLVYPDQAAARQALDGGKISAFYVIPPDYMTNGKIYAYTAEFNLSAANQRQRGLQDLIDYNLLGGNADLLQAIRQPLRDLKETNLSPKPEQQRNPDSAAAFFLPYGMMMISFVTIFGSASLMLNSISKEKENRILEVLMVSATPQEMLLGKIAGLGLVGLLQIVVWGASAVALMNLSGQTFALPAEFHLSPTLVAWAVAFYVLGYLVYAALMAGIGALVPNLREASQATVVIMIPMMAPFFLINALLAEPNGGLATFFSLFPFTASMTMMLRLASGQVPLWQLLLALALLALTALLVIRVVAGLFRAQNLLSGQPFNLRRLVAALRGG